MAIPQLDPAAAVNDLRVYLRGQGAEFDAERAELIVELAMQQVERYVAPTPAAARGIVLAAATRGYTNPVGVQSRTTGPFSETYRQQDRAGVYLTADEVTEVQAMTDTDTATSSGAFTIYPGGLGAPRP